MDGPIAEIHSEGAPGSWKLRVFEPQAFVVEDFQGTVIGGMSVYGVLYTTMGNFQGGLLG